jgi:GT2 family glycosyltransferase
VSDLTISIVNYNASEYLSNCLESIKKYGKGISLEVWVVDNASSDGSAEAAKIKFPEVNFIFNKENLGFGKAHNQILKKIKSPYVLLLNPDSELKEGTLKHMLEYMDDHPETGAASCKVVKADGSLDWASHRGFPTPLASLLYFFFKNDSLYNLNNRDLNKPHEVDEIVGAFFLTKKEVLDKVGIFDEDYFLYAEDLDLCFRIKEAGYKIMYVPDVEILHLKGISSGIKSHTKEFSTASQESKKKSLDSFYQTMIIFYRKNLSKRYPFFINWLVYLGINLKWFLAKIGRVV